MRPRIYGDAAARLWGRVEKGPGCWLWTGLLNDSGYGILRLANNRNIRTHRLAWELARGPIPRGLHVLHHCDTPACVKTEPDDLWPDGHLFLGTQADNMRDMQAKGRARKGDPEQFRSLSPEQRPRGSGHGMSKLTEDTVREIRRLGAAGTPERVLGQQYGVSGAAIHQVLHKRTWAHVHEGE